MIKFLFYVDCLTFRLIRFCSNLIPNEKFQTFVFSKEFTDILLVLSFRTERSWILLLISKILSCLKSMMVNLFISSGSKGRLLSLLVHLLFIFMVRLAKNDVRRILMLFDNLFTYHLNLLNNDWRRSLLIFHGDDMYRRFFAFN